MDRISRIARKILPNNPRPSLYYVKGHFKRPISIVEVGTFCGDNAVNMAKILEIDKLHLVDLWENFKDLQIALSQVNGTFHRRSSIVVSEEFERQSIDFVYIDAAHDYKSVWEDIRAWWPKIKMGGIIAGHDYHGDVKKAIDNYFAYIVVFKLKGNAEWLVHKS